MNNTTIDAKCQWYHDNSYPAYIFGYVFATITYFFFSGIGHLICLLAFYQQRKKETAFTYQLFVVISETIEIIMYTFYITTFHWFSGAEDGGTDWFMSCYPCMFYAGRLSIPFLNMFITSSLFFSIAVTADRIFALCKPYMYKSINHKRHQMVALFCCYLIGISTSLFDINRFNVELDIQTNNTFIGKYKINLNNNFLNSELANVATQIRNVTRICGIICLILANVALLISYRLRVKKVGKMANINVDKAETRRKNTQHTLMLLAILDSLLNASGISLLIFYHMVFYWVPTFFTCGSSFYTPLLDAILQFSDIGDFYLAFAVSKQFRQMILELPCLKWCRKVSTIDSASLNVKPCANQVVCSDVQSSVPKIRLFQSKDKDKAFEAD